MNKTQNETSIDAYDYYLADLIREIEKNCVPLEPKESNGEFIYSAPPIPPFLKALDKSVHEKIWGVEQNYFLYIKHTSLDDIKKVAKAIYVAAEQIFKIHQEKNKNRLGSIEDYLTIDTLVYRNLEQKDDAYLYYFILAFMRIGLLLKSVNHSSKENQNIEVDYILEILKEARTKHRLFEKIEHIKEKQRLAEQNNKTENKAIGSEGGQKKDSEYFKPCRDYAFRFYKKICNCPKYKYNKVIARDIHPRLKKKVEKGIFQKCPTEGVFLKTWIPNFKKRFPPTR